MGRKSNTPPLDQQQQSAASGERNELRQVAALRLPGRRTVRLEEQQKQRFFFRFRPVAHPPERQSRWATRPAVRRTALLAFGLSGRSLRGLG